MAPDNLENLDYELEVQREAQRHREATANAIVADRTRRNVALIDRGGRPIGQVQVFGTGGELNTRSFREAWTQENPENMPTLVTPHNSELSFDGVGDSWHRSNIEYAINSGQVNSDRDIPMGQGILAQVEAAGNTVNYEPLTQERLEGAIANLDNNNELAVARDNVWSDMVIGDVGVPSAPLMHSIPSNRDLPPNPEEGSIFFVQEDATTYTYSNGEYLILQREGNDISLVERMQPLQNELNIAHYRNQVSIAREHYSMGDNSEVDAYVKEQENKILYGTPGNPNFSPKESTIPGFLKNIKIIE